MRVNQGVMYVINIELLAKVEWFPQHLFSVFCECRLKQIVIVHFVIFQMKCQYSVKSRQL